MTPVNTTMTKLSGLGVSDGVAIGKAVCISTSLVDDVIQIPLPQGELDTEVFLGGLKQAVEQRNRAIALVAFGRYARGTLALIHTDGSQAGFDGARAGLLPRRVTSSSSTRRCRRRDGCLRAHARPPRGRFGRGGR